MFWLAILDINMAKAIRDAFFFFYHRRVYANDTLKG
jgi:hypothetical protein